jgi:acyl carrier protein
VVVARVDWSVLVPLYETRRHRPFFEELDSKNVSRQAAKIPAGGGMVQRLEVARTSERRALLVELVRVEAAGVLGLALDDVSVTQGLFDMGMDSLMSVNLKSRLESGIGRKLPSTLTFNFPTVAAIAGQLEKELPELFNRPPSVAVVPSVSAPSELDDDLSEQELAALLAEKLGR